MAPNSRKNARQDKSATHYSEDVDCENRMGCSRFFQARHRETFLHTLASCIFARVYLCIINSLAKIYTNLYLVQVLMVPILCRISISAKEYVGHIQIYVVPIFIPLSSRSCGLGITTIVEGVSTLFSLTKVHFFTISSSFLPVHISSDEVFSKILNKLHIHIA